MVDDCITEWQLVYKVECWKSWSAGIAEVLELLRAWSNGGLAVMEGLNLSSPFH